MGLKKIRAFWKNAPSVYPAEKITGPLDAENR